MSKKVVREKIFLEPRDIVEFNFAVRQHAGYYELKRDRKQLMEVFIIQGAKLKEVWLDMLLKTLHYIDDKLAEFSAEEKAIYDAVYGG